MRTLVTGRTTPSKPTGSLQGFTLVEILLVLMILALAASMLVPSLGDSPSLQLQREASRLKTMLEIASEEAVMEGVEISLASSENDDAIVGYQFLLLDQESLEWTQPEAKLFSYYEMNPKIAMKVELTKNANQVPDYDQQITRMLDSNKQQSWRPLLLLLSSGEISPFTIELVHADIDGITTLKSDGISGILIL